MLGCLTRSCTFARYHLLPEWAKCIVNSAGLPTAVSSRNDHLRLNWQTKVCQRVIHTDTSALSSRGLSYNTTSAPLAKKITFASKDDSREFMALFPDVVRDLTEAGKNLDIPEVTKWFAKVLQYNVPGGKKNRGMALYYAYRMLTPDNERTPENLRLAMIMGWSLEILQAFFLVADDICDEAETRRGRPCWYKVNNLGVTALNDAILLEHGTYELLRKHFRDKPYYLNVVDLFHTATMKTIMGQVLDMQSSGGDEPKLEKFTMNLYTSIVRYKTAYYSFYLPVACAMHMVGIEDPEMHRQAKTILLEIGHFFQIQDDFLDCFGEEEVTGKIGTDIQDGKCSWLAVVALQRATPEQKAIMKECYGRKDPEKVQRVRQLYETLGLPATYAVYEEETYNLIRTHIQQVSRGLPVALFLRILDAIYKRSS